MKRPRQPIWYSLVAVVVSTIFIAALCIWYTNYAVRESDRQFCELITVLDEAYTAPDAPPPTERGKRIGLAIRKLRADFGC